MDIHRKKAEQYQGLFNLMSKEYNLILTISEMDEIIIEAQKVINKISFKPMLADVNPLKDFLLGLRFAEHPGIRKEAQRLLGIYFS